MEGIPVTAVIIIVVAGLGAVGIGLLIKTYMEPVRAGKVIKHYSRGDGYQVFQVEGRTSLEDNIDVATADQRMCIRGTWLRTRWVAAPRNFKKNHPIGSYYDMDDPRGTRAKAQLPKGQQPS